MQSIFNYKVYIFDCDGVILDSNKLKINAMESALYSIFTDQVKINQCIEYFRNNFGKSRFHHIDVFIKKFLLLNELEIEKNKNLILKAYSSQCKKLYLSADISPGFIDFIKKLNGTKYVASGSEQEELREIFKIRNLNQYFNDIYGSPTKKSEIISNILTLENTKNAIMIGDAISDLESALINNINFIAYLPFSNVPLELTKLTIANEFKILNTWPKDINLQ